MTCTWSLLSVLLLAACSKAPGPFRAGTSEVGAVADPAWDALFTRTTGWTGADGAYSVDLQDGRALWLFSDSWVGQVQDGKHAAGSVLVNNTLAVHPTSAAGQPPADLTFLWGTRTDGAPAAWITPDPTRVHAHGDESGGNGYYWMGDGAVAPGADGQPRLVLLLHHIGQRAGDHGVWGFKSVGGALAVIANPREPAPTWQVQQFANPFTIYADLAAATPGLAELAWGNAVLYEAAQGGPMGGYLYIYGVRESDPLNKQLFLARAPATQVEQFTTWEFRTADGWSAAPAMARPIADGASNELSVHLLGEGPGRTYVMVYSEPLFGSHILVRTARAPQGPWSAPLAVYTVRDIERDASYFTYGAKGHLHLSPPGELLVTYVVNAQDFWAMVRDAQIYHPRFVRVPLSALPAAP